MGHGHGTPEFGATTGSLWLQILGVAAGLLVAVIAVRRPLGRTAAPWADLMATVASATAVLVYLLLADGLAVPRQGVPLLLAAVGLPLLVTAGRGGVPDATVRLLRGAAPLVMTGAATGAALLCAQSWFGSTRSPDHLHTGLVLALVASSWALLCRPGPGLRAAYVHAVTVAVAGVLVVGTVHADAIATAT